MGRRGRDGRLRRGRVWYHAALRWRYADEGIDGGIQLHLQRLVADGCGGYRRCDLHGPVQRDEAQLHNHVGEHRRRGRRRHIDRRVRPDTCLRRGDADEGIDCGIQLHLQRLVADGCGSDGRSDLHGAVQRDEAQLYGLVGCRGRDGRIRSGRVRHDADLRRRYADEGIDGGIQLHLQRLVADRCRCHG